MKYSFHKQQRGIAHVMALLLVLVVVGVGGAGYYVLSKNKDKDTNSSTSQSASEKKAAEAECKRTIEDKDLCKAASSFDYDKGNYVLTITGEEDGQQYTWTLESDGGNSKTNILGMETVIYDGATYMKQATGGWVKYPSSEGDEDSDVTESLNFSDEEASWYTKVGKEACGSMTCFRYSYKDPNDPTNNAEFWFDDKEYKIRRATSKTEDGTAIVMEITYGNAKVSAPETFTELTN